MITKHPGGGSRDLNPPIPPRNVLVILSFIFIACWAIFPGLFGFGDGLLYPQGRRDNPYHPFQHHYQIVCPTYELGHLIGVGTGTARDWLAK